MTTKPTFCGGKLEVYDGSQRQHPEGKQGLHWTGSIWEANVTTSATYCGYNSGGEYDIRRFFYICRRCAKRQGLIW